MQRLFDAVQESAQVIGRRGMLSTVAPTMLLLVTETFVNEPPPMSLLTAEEFSNEPPAMSLLVTDGFENDAPPMSLLVASQFNGYSWIPNVLIDCRKDNAIFGAHINVEITYEQEISAGVWQQLRFTPFGTLLETSYPARQHRATVPATYVEFSEAEQKNIIYDAVSTSLTFHPSYTEKTEFVFVYIRRVV